MTRLNIENVPNNSILQCFPAVKIVGSDSSKISMCEMRIVYKNKFLRARRRDIKLFSNCKLWRCSSAFGLEVLLKILFAPGATWLSLIWLTTRIQFHGNNSIFLLQMAKTDSSRTHLDIFSYTLIFRPESEY